MKKTVRFLSFLLCAVLLTGALAACSGPADRPQQPTDADTGERSSADSGNEEFVYTYGKTDFEPGTVFTFCNLNQLWDMYIYLDASSSGNKVDKAVYSRNRLVENDMKCVIKIDERGWNYDFAPYLDAINQAIQTDLSDWDAIWLPVNKRPDLVTMGRFRDLAEIDNLNLTSDWWDGTLNGQFMLSDRLYFASSPLQLMSFDTAWGIFFNIDLITDYEMEDPRTLVADNQWTVDRLMTMCRENATLNGSESYYWDKETRQIYGIAAHPNLLDKLLYAAGERYVTKDSDDIPVYSAGGSRFVDVVGKLARFLGAEYNLEASSNDMAADGDEIKGGGYIYAFSNRRAFFMGAEIKAARQLKSLDQVVNYGLVPMPKYDARQQSYYTPIVESLLVMTIPATCRREENAGAVLDALAYYSMTDVLPAYYSNILYRGYDPADEPMFEILKKTRGVDMAYYYNWNTELAEQVRDRIFDGTGAVSDQLTNASTQIPTRIATWRKTLEKLGI